MLSNSICSDLVSLMLLDTKNIAEITHVTFDVCLDLISLILSDCKKLAQLPLATFEV